MGMFKRAVKSESKLRLAIAGPSGSGKTYTALRLAEGIARGGEIAVLDTEHGSASKYADEFTFDVMQLDGDYHPDHYVNAIADAARAGYSVIILDSLTHAWNGPGGVLSLVDQAATRSKSGNTYTAWKDITPIHDRLIQAILGAPIHVIATMRSKQEYVIEKNSQGRDAPRKVGMAPIQRDGMEYEFDIMLDMDLDNNAIVSKSRARSLSGKVFAKPGADVAALILEWLSGEPENPRDADRRAALAQIGTDPKLAYAWVDSLGLPGMDAEGAKIVLQTLVNAEFAGRFQKSNAGQVIARFVDQILNFRDDPPADAPAPAPEPAEELPF